jgi:hypothetical protein
MRCYILTDTRQLTVPVGLVIITTVADAATSTDSDGCETSSRLFSSPPNQFGVFNYFTPTSPVF